MKIPVHKEVKHSPKQVKNETDVFKNKEKLVTREGPCHDRDRK